MRGDAGGRRELLPMALAVVERQSENGEARMLGESRDCGRIEAAGQENDGALPFHPLFL